MFVLIKECFGETNFVHFLTAKALDFVDFLHLKITDFFLQLEKFGK
jgi:hypothetical protein